MLQIVLIRPGATDYDQQGRIQGSLEIPLNEAGAVEIDRISRDLKALAIETIYAPDTEPARQTATILAGALGAKQKKLPHLENLHHGLWEGMLIEEVKRKQPKVYRQWQDQPESVCPPQGEMLDAARERVQAALIRLVKKHKYGVVAVVVPEPLASLVRSMLEGKELGDLWQAPHVHGTWDLINVEPHAVVNSH